MTGEKKLIRQGRTKQPPAETNETIQERIAKERKSEGVVVNSDGSLAHHPA